jgi:type VI secretion system protein ImpG
MNGDRPANLATGDVHVPTSSTPSAVLPINVTRPSRSWQPLLDGRLQWQLISSLALNFVSLQDANALREILANLDIPARHDRKMERLSKQRLQAIVSIRSEAAERLFRGVPVRGTRTIIDVEESNFSSEGAMVLFGNVLDKLMEMFVTVNSFHELTMRGIETGEEYKWATKSGSRPLI